MDRILSNHTPVNMAHGALCAWLSMTFYPTGSFFEWLAGAMIVAAIVTITMLKFTVELRVIMMALMLLTAIGIHVQDSSGVDAQNHIDAFQYAVIGGSYESIQVSDEGIVDVEIGTGNCLEIDPSKLSPVLFRFYRNSGTEFDNMGSIGDSIHTSYVQICDGYIRLV